MSSQQSEPQPNDLDVLGRIPAETLLAVGDELLGLAPEQRLERYREITRFHPELAKLALAYAHRAGEEHGGSAEQGFIEGVEFVYSAIRATKENGKLEFSHSADMAPSDPAAA